jgi:SAM-dependent methyltransferase
LRLLRAAKLPAGRVVELGSGSGIQSAIVQAAGYDVAGFDISPAMVAIARRRVPQATFEVASFLDVAIPRCIAVTAVGEIFNYLFDERNSLARLATVFRRVYKALLPGGVFLFDVALVGRVPGGLAKNVRQTDDWTCVFEAEEFADRKALERRITTFRRVGRHYRRDDEIHRLRLYEVDELREPLEQLGFEVRTVRKYGDFTFPPGYRGFIARKR